MDIILDEETDIAVSTQKPEKFCHDSLPVDTLGREEWKSVSEVESELSPEETIGDISTSEIFIVDTIFDEFSTEVEVLLFWMDFDHRVNIRIYYLSS